MPSSLNITRSDIRIAVEIMCEAANWLMDGGQPMWRLDDLTPERILDGIQPENVCVGWVQGKSAASMILQWGDPIFWPEVSDDSGFIHKLCVRRRYAGTGLSLQMIEWATEEAKRRDRKYLRLDCAADRPRLCAVYEEMGFRRVDRRMVGSLDTAFYERVLI